MNAAQKTAIIRLTNDMQRGTYRKLSFNIEAVGSQIMVNASNCDTAGLSESLYCEYAFVGPRGGVRNRTRKTFN